MMKRKRAFVEGVCIALDKGRFDISDTASGQTVQQDRIGMTAIRPAADGKNSFLHDVLPEMSKFVKGPVSRERRFHAAFLIFLTIDAKIIARRRQENTIAR